MTGSAAIRAAVELKHLPSQVHTLRRAPLPQGVTLVLRVAAGEPDALSEAMKFTGRTAEVVKSASEFFVEQILLFSGADCYRVLGARPDAHISELRYHMALLLRWLHPDLDPTGQRAVMAAHVTKAWENLKIPERRASYDVSRSSPLLAETRGTNFSIRRRKKQQTASSPVRRDGIQGYDRPNWQRRSVLQKAIDLLHSLRSGSE